MKKSISRYAAVAIAGMMLASCNADDEFAELAPSRSDVQPVASKTFTASFDGDGSLSKARQSDVWSSMSIDDQMAVFSAEKNNQFVLKSIIGCFVGDAADSTKYYALFPYQEGASIKGNVISATVAGEQQYLNGNDNYNFNPSVLSVGVTDNESRHFALRHIGAEILFRVSGKSPITKVVFKANKKIAGDVQITVDDNGIPTVSEGTLDEVVFNIGDTIYYANYVSVLPAGEVDIDVSYYRGDKEVGKRTLKNVNLSRNRIANIDLINRINVKFETGVEGKKIDDISVGEEATFYLPSPSDYDVTNGEFTFAGWKDADGNIYAPGSTVQVGNEDVTFTAEWTKDLVLTFRCDGIESISPIIFKSGDEISLPEPKMLLGYTFKGWQVAADKNMQPGEKFKPESNMTLVPNVELTKFKLTVDANGGKFADGKDKLEIEVTLNHQVNFGDWNGAVQRFQIRCIENWNWDESVWYDMPTRDGYQYEGLVNTNGYFYGFASDSLVVVKWSKLYYVTYYDQEGRALTNGRSSFTESSSSFYVQSTSLPYDLGLVKAWKDDDGNIYESGKSYPLSVFDELHDINLHPVMDEEGGSTSEEWKNKQL